MIFRSSKILVFLAITSLVTGCKLALIVVEGGQVTSPGLGLCTEGTICVYEVNDHTFNETFTASPNAGWNFVRWNSGGDFFCEDDISLTCNVSNEGTGEIASIAAIVNSDKAFYIMPIFTEVGLPVDSVNAADGNEWAQPIQFAGLSYADIAMACPGGTCSGTLNGYNMTGWTWASGAQVRPLLVIYAVGSICAAVPCLSVSDPAGGSAAIADGFISTQLWPLSGGPMLDGITSDPEPVSYAGVWDDGVVLVPGFIDIGNDNTETIDETPPNGAWFFK